MTQPETLADAATVMWTGRSGAPYQFLRRHPAELHVSDDVICVLTARTRDGEAIVWSGTATSLIEDPASRDLFRAALPRAASAYTMPAPRDAIDLMTVLWDLEPAQHLPSRNAAAA
jgi:hypothetical protein